MFDVQLVSIGRFVADVQQEHRNGGQQSRGHDPEGREVIHPGQEQARGDGTRGVALIPISPRVGNFLRRKSS